MVASDGPDLSDSGAGDRREMGLNQMSQEYDYPVDHEGLPKGVDYHARHCLVQLKTANMPGGQRNERDGFQVFRLSIDSEGAMTVPMFRVKRPRKGAFGQVSDSTAWVDLLEFLGRRYPYLRLPVDQGIAEHVILVRRLSDSGAKMHERWHVWSVLPDAIRESQTLQLPAFNELPEMSERFDPDTVRQKMDEATAARDQLETWAE